MRMKLHCSIIKLLLIASILFFIASNAQAYVPVRISVKFILDSAGLPPGSGNCSEHEDVNDQIDRGNEILMNMMSEYRIDMIEIVDLSDVGGYYNDDINETTRDSLRTDAQNDSTLYHWRTDAINIYINGNGGSGIAGGTPDNDIILIGQGCRDTTVIHEIGHNLDLWHTHEPCCFWVTSQDHCEDTVTDNSSWTRDEVALDNYDDVYANLTTVQQNSIDATWFNVMSYHPVRDRLTHCQMNRQSEQGDSDRSWLLSKQPLYVNSEYSGYPGELGFFRFPYNTLQEAVDVGLSGQVLVLQQGTYNISTAITDNVEIVTRFGSSTVNGPDNQLFVLPTGLENSHNSKVRDAINNSRSEDAKARKAVNSGRLNSKRSGIKPDEKAAILSVAEAKRKQHAAKAITHLLNAERHATGNEKIAIQLELAQRYRHSGNCNKAVKFYNLVAESTEQIHLRDKALKHISQCNQSLNKAKPRQKSKP